MTAPTTPLAASRTRPWPRRRPSLAREGVHRALGRLDAGTLVVRDAFGTRTFGGARPGPRARVDVDAPGFYGRLARRGILGAAEGYMRGEWRCDDPTALVRMVLRNGATQGAFGHPLTRVLELPSRALHALRRNTRAGSRRNIAAHYDLGNDFFERVLDPTLTYSCAVFERADATLEEAQVAKYERLCRNLDIRPGEHVLEVGCGWGGFAIHAARSHDCRVTATTLSRAQYEVARERVAAAGLEGRVEILREDYRDLRGRFDKLVSIEMIEAVGHPYLGRFLRTCAERLEPDGAMALQAITIADQHYERAKRTVDFIKRYVFPGGFLPSTTAILGATTSSTDLRLVRLEDLTAHYAETLRHWRARFERHRDELRGRGYGDETLRMWDFYLAYCEGGFEERHIGTVQLLFAKPAWRHRPELR